MSRFLFPMCLFLSALLLFSIQPMAAKSLLPIYGGTPAVWIVCMLFFQLILLLAYSYVWLLSSFNKPWMWRGAHLIVLLLSVISLPVTLIPIVMEGQPEWTILYSLLTQLGLPLLVIGASAPLLQLAYSQTQNKGAKDPYFLYIASNLGSLIALLIYPWVIERFIGLKNQFYLWGIAYCFYLVFLALLLLLVRYNSIKQAIGDAKKILMGDALYWIVLSFAPCSLMLGLTLYITSDVAPTPLFWILPLAMYLLSFIVTFTEKPLISFEWATRNCPFFLVFTVLCFIFGLNQINTWFIVVFNLLNFFILAFICHRHLFLNRPNPQHLTVFYFCLALGGVLAGLFNGVLAPHLFHQIYEYPIAILLCLFFLPNTHKGGRIWGSSLIVLVLILFAYFFATEPRFSQYINTQYIAIFALLIALVWQGSRFNLMFSMLILFSFIFYPFLQQNNILVQERNFFGVKQVYDKNGTHLLFSQSTIHGLQAMDEKKPLRGQSSYYGAVENVIKTMQQNSGSMQATIVGLGIGTMVCQFRSTDKVSVVDVDQQVIDIAKNPKLFTYLRDCLPHLKIIKNDGRLALAKTADKSQDLIVLDAFSSDAVPIHLMTVEAFDLYRKKMTSEGGILVHLSNRHLDLLPVTNAAGHSLELIVLHLTHRGDPKLGQMSSEWALLTYNAQLALNLMKNSGWHFMTDEKQFLWTDDYSNIVPLLRG